jgi:eukaryotic-like serine/threonine-protein kinase
MAQPSPEIPGWPALELLEQCAGDGLADLFRGRLSPRGTTVVLKVLRSVAPPDAPPLTCFHREAHLLSRLSHPHVVRLVDVGDTEGRPYLVLEDVAGGDLTDRVKGAPLAPAEAARLIEKVARALHHAHERGVILRGLSARAVRFTEGGEPKLYDFSMARELSAGPPDEPGTIVGTPIYLAPEQAAGKSSEISPRTDVYSLAPNDCFSASLKCEMGQVDEKPQGKARVRRDA